MDTSFLPRGFLASPHVQTLTAGIPVLRRTPRGVRGQTLTFPLGDGSQALHARGFFQPWPSTAVLIIHGVGGTSDSPYMHRAARALVQAGFHAICLDMRGAGRGLSLATSLYHAGLTEDIEATVACLRARSGVTDVAIVGMSLGGQIALLAASRWGQRGERPVRAVVSVSAPMNLDAGCRMLDDGPQVVYREYILRGLVRTGLRMAHQAAKSMPLTPQQLRKVRRIREYDDRVIAPMHGFADASDYYAQASCGPHLGNIITPTLCIQAMDDPVVPFSTLEPFFAHASPAVVMRHSRTGGHVGFLGGIRQWGRNWAVDQAIAFIAATPGGRALDV